MAEATRGTCLTRANQVAAIGAATATLESHANTRDLNFFVLGRFQYLPVNFYEVNRVASFWDKRNHKRMVADRR